MDGSVGVSTDPFVSVGSSAGTSSPVAAGAARPGPSTTTASTRAPSGIQRVRGGGKGGSIGTTQAPLYRPAKMPAYAVVPFSASTPITPGGAFVRAVSSPAQRSAVSCSSS